MGNHLKELREERRWTQEETANRLGISRSGYIKLERGERRLDDQRIAAAARVFGVPPSDVIGDEAAKGVAVPLLGWVSAGLLMRDDVSSEALGTINVSDLPPGDWIALRVLGESMDRISPPESVIFVDRRDKRLVPNALYVIADEEGNTSYKRYRPGPPARFEPVSTNQNLEPIFPTSEPVIIGRVRRTVLDT